MKLKSMVWLLGICILPWWHFTALAIESAKEFDSLSLIQWKPIEYIPVPNLNCLEPRASECQQQAIKATDQYEKLRIGWLEDLDIQKTDYFLMEPTKDVEALEKVYHRQSTKISLQKNANSPTAILVHGLFEDGYQMEKFETTLFSFGFNVINLVLSGHGVDTIGGQSLRSERWQSDLLAAYKFAAQISEKILLAGDSTGGLLVADLAAQDLPGITALVLAEPALRTQQYVAAAACAASDQVTQLGELNGLAKSLAGVNIPSMKAALSMQMACEVDILRRKIAFRNPIKSYTEDNFNDLSAGLEGLYAKIKIPTLILANELDVVVSNEEMKRFAKQRKDIVRYHEFRDLSHGKIPLSNAAVSELKSFAMDLFRLSGSELFFRQSLERLTQKIISDAALMENDFTNQQNLKELLKMKTFSADHLLKVHAAAVKNQNVEQLMSGGKRLRSLKSAENPDLRQLSKVGAQLDQLIENDKNTTYGEVVRRAIIGQKILLQMAAFSRGQQSFEQLTSAFGRLAEELTARDGLQTPSADKIQSRAAEFQKFQSENIAFVEKILKQNQSGELQIK